MPTACFTGARGIRHELARQYAQDGWRVHALAVLSDLGLRSEGKPFRVDLFGHLRRIAVAVFSRESGYKRPKWLFAAGSA